MRNAIIARDAPTEAQDPAWDPDDVRYSVIRRAPSTRQNALGSVNDDPRISTRELRDPAFTRKWGTAASTLGYARFNYVAQPGDAIEGADLGLRNVDRVMGYIVPATTSLGADYERLCEVYEALVLQRHRELVHVARMVRGEATRALLQALEAQLGAWVRAPWTDAPPEPTPPADGAGAGTR